ncbi:MAG: cytochrome b/b6 domain-containing protein [Caldilineaceae bacterium]
MTKFFHWAVFIGFVFQYFVASVMLRISQAESFWGFTQGFLYNWHKSVGLIIFGVVICRYLWRRFTSLPNWAPTLTKRERVWVHWIERILYLCMFVMPISGYMFVMAGGYGVNFFGVYPLPNPIGKIPWLALLAEYTHWITAITIVVTWLCHMALVFKHQLIDRDRLLHRMLPLTHQK